MININFKNLLQETKSKKYAKIILELKKEKINNKNIIELETELCKYNRKTLQFNKFKDYIKKKNELNTSLFSFYEKEIFRKLKLNGYLNRKRNEQKMINQFKKIFPNPNEKNEIEIEIENENENENLKVIDGYASKFASFL